MNVAKKNGGNAKHQQQHSSGGEEGRTNEEGKHTPTEPCDAKLFEATSNHLGSYVGYASKMLVLSYVHGDRALTLHVLVLGGYMGNEESKEGNNVHAYDVTSATWRKMASLPTPRIHAKAVFLDGNVYVIGGFNQRGTLSTVDVYCPEKDEWIANQSRMKNARHTFGVCTWLGKIFVFGGCNNEFEAMKNCEVYDPETREWTSIEPLDKETMGASSVVVNGQILVLGGQNSHAPTAVSNAVRTYDPRNDSWSTGTEMLHSRSDFGCVALPHSVFAFAGDQGNNYLMSAERFDFGDSKWTQLGECGTPRSGFGFFYYKGSIYALGGYAAERLSSSERLEIRSGKWYDIPDLPTERSGHCCVSYETLSSKG